MAERVERFVGLGQATKKLSSRLMVALLIVALVGFLGLFLWQSLQIKKMQDEYDQKKAQLAAVQERNARLQEHLDFYKGPGYLLYVEKVAREALGLVKPGETAVMVVSDNRNMTSSPAIGSAKSGTTGANAPPHEEKKNPNWRNWWDFFIG
jgi:cell division protein FtsB